MISRLKVAALGLAALALGACGTTYQVPDLGESEVGRAQAIFAEAQNAPRPAMSSDATALSRFNRVTARVRPVAETICARETADLEGFDCKVGFEIDTKMKQPNAYFYYKKGRPTIGFTASMLRDVQNDHELAFVLGHEYGHLIARHHHKQEQQAVAGMLIMGVLAGAAAVNNPYADPNLVGNSMDLGAQIGRHAYSQEYELESDTIGTLIARSASYDPLIGARYFARAEATRLPNGKLSFFGTHPPDAKRVATVLATVDQIETHDGILRKQPR